MERIDIVLVFSAIFLFGIIFLHAEPTQDKTVLLTFIQNISHPNSINWAKSSSACSNWTGVTCNADHTRIIAVRLTGAGLSGQIPANTLSRLSSLQILSLQSNAITGSFPSDFAKLRNLTSLYLQFNKISGTLPENFSIWENLTNIDLSNNSFNGSIPLSISNLTHLTALNLANNSLSGEIPNFNLPNLTQLDLSNNHFVGYIPESLSKFPSWVFSGNNLSSSETSLPPVFSPVSQPKKSKKLKDTTILGIALGGSFLVFLILALLIYVFRSSSDEEDDVPVKPQKGNASSKKSIPDTLDESNRLVFFEGVSLAFDLEDLLSASAEVLGKGTFGTTYKAALEDAATTVVVKRLKEVGVSKREFEQQMELVGRIRHDNVAALRAYFYSKDEKLIVYDFFGQGSVSAMLHGKRGEDRIPLDWETRLQIAIGAARGIAHIHTANGRKLVHGNIRASNIFLNSNHFGCVCDIGLATLMGPMPPPALRAAGYRAPEVSDARKASQASDVYSFGVFLLELLTGKSPVAYTGGDEVVHLVRWVNSVVREEWTAEVFDVELLRYTDIEEEMVEMLQIGMACVVRMPEGRPKMENVVRRVEEIRPLYTGNRPSFEKSEASTSVAAPPTPPPVVEPVTVPPPQMVVPPQQAVVPPPQTET